MKNRRSKSEQRMEARHDLKAIEEVLRKPLQEQGLFDYAARAQQVQEAHRWNTLASQMRFRPPHDTQIWDIHKATAERFWKAVDAAYPPGFWESCQRLKNGDAAGLETALGFLEADPYFFRSGYVKAWLTRAIKSPMLTARHKTRLQAVVLSLVDRRDDRDFRAYCRLARKVDSPELRQQLWQRLTREPPSAQSLTDDLPSLLPMIRQDRAVRRRAQWVLEALGEKVSQG